ncbi:hypothetical protein NDI76_04870 [Halogeometricum sp. S1BR25-6]|uniref:Small CPxCG-related zinc finger protein n=1 Tax=Halogeometricum salsisoli TaxID=2950536 RepID=A0ABU2GB85_9EURY|nr:HVO_0649 family zinc finger protein [Halogeometricum sp. S1BR25-6]MDS0298067.1 hypothetical protein [Halogeometricum sp. S1BR25-6]
MSYQSGIGTTTLDSLRERYNETRMRCTACGYHDADGKWTAATTGGEISYEHVCPSCGHVDEVVIKRKGADE